MREQQRSNSSGGSKLGYVHLFICTLYAMRGDDVCVCVCVILVEVKVSQVDQEIERQD